MIFVAEPESLSLYAFATEAEATAHCEGIDVENGEWLFWSDLGEPLEPHFTVPNQRGMSSAVSGSYRLVPAQSLHHAPLLEALDEFTHFEVSPPCDSAEGVRNYLMSRNR
jgi:hypothetical protein